MKTRFLLFILLILFQFPLVAQRSSTVLTEGSAGLVGMSDKKLMLIDQFYSGLCE